MTPTAPKKRCVCGRSTRFPLCDGGHKQAGWQCGRQDEDAVAYAFAGSPSLRNLADRLADRFRGASLHVVPGALRCEQLVLLTDGHDMDGLQSKRQVVQPQNVRVIGFGVPEEALSWSFPDADVVALPDPAPEALWALAEETVQSVQSPRAAAPRPTVFLSHAAADEARLFPTIRALRDGYGLQVFVCADSIPAGAAWRQSLWDRLLECDVFLLVASNAAAQSVFCAYEVGAAMALKKPVRIVSLDGQGPPTYVQDVQAADVKRLIARKPWLNTGEALLEAVLDAITAP